MNGYGRTDTDIKRVNNGVNNNEDEREQLRQQTNRMSDAESLENEGRNNNYRGIDAVINVTKQITVVGDKSPLWVCRNGVIVHKKCEYSLCNECYSTSSNNESSITQKRPKRSKRSNDENENPERCKHGINDLVFFTDASYFSVEYKKKIVDEENYFPMCCASCKKTLSNTLTSN